ncbi:MAG: helix-turn-helix transcriptional regulator [Clostridia bacterium]|nr:helix-turn-helix transcriptional regulator [Clostridia bacterium]
MIRLGEKIKALRLRDGRTQDALAEALGVTAQAVSRWEKGICYPDMEVVPSIANYFSVSIDELFGYDNERSKMADALAEKINDMISQNDGKDVSMDACIALARESLIEFPGNEKITLALASALFTAGYVRHGEHHVEDADGYSVYDAALHRTYAEWQEAIRLYEKLLLSLNSGDMRQKAVTDLAQLYKNTGEHEKALQLAQSAPDINATRAILLISACDGKEAVAASGEALLELLLKCTEMITGIVWTDVRMSPDTAAAMIGNAVAMFDLVCTDGVYGKHNAWLACLRMLRSYYLWLAGEKDGAFADLDAALAHASAYDKSGEACPEYFTAPLLRLVKTNARDVPA